MKTRSYIRYLFHSSYLSTYTHTHTRAHRGPATTRLLFRKGLNASLSLFINDGQALGWRISATEILRIARALEVGWKWWIGETWRSRVEATSIEAGASRWKDWNITQRSVAQCFTSRFGRTKGEDGGSGYRFYFESLLSVTCLLFVPWRSDFYFLLPRVSTRYEYLGEFSFKYHLFKKKKKEISVWFLEES